MTYLYLNITIYYDCLFYKLMLVCYDCFMSGILEVTYFFSYNTNVVSIWLLSYNKNKDNFSLHCFVIKILFPNNSNFESSYTQISVSYNIFSHVDIFVFHKTTYHVFMDIWEGWEICFWYNFQACLILVNTYFSTFQWMYFDNCVQTRLTYNMVLQWNIELSVGVFY